MGTVRLRTQKEEGEQENRKALLSQAHDHDKGSDTYYDSTFSRANNKAPESDVAAYSYMVPRHLNVNSNATRIYNVTQDECGIYCAQQNPLPTFFSYTDNKMGFTSCACPGAQCTIVFGVPDTNVFWIIAVTDSPTSAPTASPTSAPTAAGDTRAPTVVPNTSAPSSVRWAFHFWFVCFVPWLSSIFLFPGP